MLTPKYYLTNNLVLWLGDKVLLNRIGIWRIVFGKPDRIILEIDLPDMYEILKYPDGFTLDLLHKEAGRHDTKTDTELVASFRDCALRRKWIPRPMSRGNETSVVAVFAEYTCEIEGKWTQ